MLGPKFGRSDLSEPRGIAINAGGHLFVISRITCRIHVLTRMARLFDHLEASEMNLDNLGSLGNFIDNWGNLLIADEQANRIQIYSQEGQFKYKFGIQTSPRGIVMDDKGNIIVTSNHKFQVFGVDE